MAVFGFNRIFPRQMTAAIFIAESHLRTAAQSERQV